MWNVNYMYIRDPLWIIWNIVENVCYIPGAGPSPHPPKLESGNPPAFRAALGAIGPPKSPPKAGPSGPGPSIGPGTPIGPGPKSLNAPGGADVKLPD